jgi:hypothetical protein
MFGEDSMAESLDKVLRKRLCSLDIAREIMPIWTDWGAKDIGVWVHSLGCAFWTALGQKLGYVALSEAPTLPQGQYADAGTGVRSDSLWFDRETRKPKLILEFERYVGIGDSEKLMGKVQNLLLAHHRWEETSEILVLAYWTKGLASSPQHSSLSKAIREGFETESKQRVQGSYKGQILFFQFVMHEEKDGVLRLHEIIERGV